MWNRQFSFHWRKPTRKNDTSLPLPSMNFRNPDQLRKNSPPTSRESREDVEQFPGLHPQCCIPSKPHQALGQAFTYIKEKSRDWCETLYVNQAQTVREVSFSGSNIKKPKRRQNQNHHQKQTQTHAHKTETVSWGISYCFSTKTTLFFYSIVNAAFFSCAFSLSAGADHQLLARDIMPDYNNPYRINEQFTMAKNVTFTM